MKQEELDEMLKEAPGPINFTVFLTMFGEKLKGETRFRCRQGQAFKIRLNLKSELILYRCRSRGDHPERLQGLRPRGKRNVEERLVSGAVCRGGQESAP